MKTNCLTKLFAEAAGEAEALEREWAGCQEKPPLFGLPISVKENIRVRSCLAQQLFGLGEGLNLAKVALHDSTIGYAGALCQPSMEDAVVVGALRKAGAVPFAGTNLPQGTASFGSFNPVYGRHPGWQREIKCGLYEGTTTHPLNAGRTPGGSSSGEGALVGLGGSPLGLASDILGSTRVPAHFCGLFGFKATSARMSGKGAAFALGGIRGVHKAIGPVSRDVQAQISFHRVLWTPPVK